MKELDPVRAEYLLEWQQAHDLVEKMAPPNMFQAGDVVIKNFSDHLCGFIHEGLVACYSETIFTKKRLDKLFGVGSWISLSYFSQKGKTICTGQYVAKLESRISIFSLSLMRQMVADHPILSNHVINDFGCSQLNEVYSLNLRASTPIQRVVLALLDYRHLAGVPEVVFSVADLAHLAFTSRTVVVKTLNDLKEKGLVQGSYRNYSLAEIHELQKYLVQLRKK